ncbi:MAG: hypothetical protein HY060_21630 [Proteobacteria bacterium]|nr:hypothetical protein [Pseudomonadota bacterium]
MTRLLLLLLALQFTPIAAWAAPMCTDTRASTARPMREGDFELYRAERNLDLLTSLTEPFGQAIAKANDRQSVDPSQLPTAPTFLSSYPNALHQIHGTLLKQRALMAEQDLALAKAHRNAQEARTARANLEVALREFCAFLADTHYID